MKFWIKPRFQGQTEILGQYEILGQTQILGQIEILGKTEILSLSKIDENLDKTDPKLLEKFAMKESKLPHCAMVGFIGLNIIAKALANNQLILLKCIFKYLPVCERVPNWKRL